MPILRALLNFIHNTAHLIITLASFPFSVFFGGINILFGGDEFPEYPTQAQAHREAYRVSLRRIHIVLGITNIVAIPFSLFSVVGLLFFMGFISTVSYAEPGAPYSPDAITQGYFFDLPFLPINYVLPILGIIGIITYWIVLYTYVVPYIARSRAQCKAPYAPALQAHRNKRRAKKQRVTTTQRPMMAGQSTWPATPDEHAAAYRDWHVSHGKS